MNTTTEVAHRFYRALAEGDGSALFDLLTDDFVGVVSAGMPHGVGGEHHGRVAMITDVWARIDSMYDVQPVPAQFLATEDREQVVVLGAYRGSARAGTERVDAAFAHIITVRNGQITALQQITDTARWHIPA